MEGKVKRIIAIGVLSFIVSIPAFSSDVKISFSGKLGYSYLIYAKDSFQTVTGSPGGIIYGGEARVDLPYGIFLNGGVDYFKKSGNRVFVSGDKVFKTDIPLSASMLSVTGGGGYQFLPDSSFSPYLGGGIGWFRYKELSQAEVPIPGFNKSKVGLYILGGVKFLKRGKLSFSFEGRWSYLPDMIGEAGVSSYYEEDNLGRISVFFAVNYRLN
jgi:opacity protein-like surface antigen